MTDFCFYSYNNSRYNESGEIGVSQGEGIISKIWRTLAAIEYIDREP